MSDRTAIEWTDSTFNPWIGCTAIGPGCDHCYAEAMMDTRRHVVEWGVGKPRKHTSPAYWQQPRRWNRADFRECLCGWRGEIDTLESDACPQCARHEHLNPARRRVFCASLADVFDNEVDPQWRHDLFSLIRDTPNLDWLVLTKRIGNAAKMVDDALGILPPNVWLGATIVNQAEADRDIPKLLAVQATKRFLSCEPLLGVLDLRHVGRYVDSSLNIDALTGWTSRGDLAMKPSECSIGGVASKELPAIDWVIVGGESGHHARPMHPDWARQLRDQCAAANVPFLFKQWGEYRPHVNEAHYTNGGEEKPSNAHAWVDGETGEHGLCWIYDEDFTWQNWTGDPRLASEEEDNENSETLHEAINVMGRYGKKKAGRTLDGREHSEFPRVMPHEGEIIHDAGVVTLLLDNRWVPHEPTWPGYERLPWRFKFMAGNWHAIATFSIDPQPETQRVRVRVPFLFRWLRLPRWRRVTINKNVVVVGYQRYCPDAQPPRFFDDQRHVITGDKFSLSTVLSE